MFKKIKTDEDVLSIGRDAYQQSIDGWRDDDTAARKDLEFRRNEQWSKAALASREGERPAMTFNVLDRFVDRLVGEAEQNPIAIDVLPVDGRTDKFTAWLMSGILRAIQYDSNSRDAIIWAAECAAGSGRGYFQLVKEYAHDRSMDEVLRFVQIYDPLMVRVDPFSFSQDLTDAGYAFVLNTYSSQVYEKTFGKDATLSDFDMVDDLTAQNWFVRTGSDAQAVKNYLVAEFHWKEEHAYRIGELDGGQVVKLVKDPATMEGDTRKDPESGVEFVFIDGQFQPLVRVRKVETNRVYKQLMAGHTVLGKKEEWIGTELPIYGIYGKQIIGDGKRVTKSAIRNGLDSQTLVNTMFTSAGEVVTSSTKAPWLALYEAVKAHKGRWEGANDPRTQVLFYDLVAEAPNGGKPERANPGVSIDAQFMAATQALGLLNHTLGMPAAMLGEDSSEKSGRAIIARTREGEVSSNWLPAATTESMVSVGKDLVKLIPEVYTGSRVMQAILEDLGEKSRPVSIGVNGAQVPGQDEEIRGQAERAEVDIPEEVDLMDLGLDPADYNVIVTTTKAYASRRMEASETIQALLPGMPPELQAIMIPHFLDYLDVPGMAGLVQEIKQFRMQGSNVDPAVIEQIAVTLAQAPGFIEGLAQAVLEFPLDQLQQPGQPGTPGQEGVSGGGPQ